MKKIEVVAAIIYFKNNILCVQRPQNKLHYISEKFEFPYMFFMDKIKEIKFEDHRDLCIKIIN